MADDDLCAGTRIGRFVLSSHLGTGGMGSVWSAYADDEPGKLVALKILHPNLATTREARERLLREARVSKLVAHPGIVPMRDALEADGQMFLVMDCLVGETLRALLRRETQLPYPAACSLFGEVASVLSVAHAKGVIHRDLKPENVFIVAGEGPGRVRVLDFGIAKIFENPPPGITPLTAINSVLGTIAYMAPEQWTHASQVDFRADIWAFGMMFYETLAGFRPIDGESNKQIMRRLLTEAVPPLHSVVMGVPEELARLTSRMVMKTPAQRPTSREIQAVLGRFG